VEFYTSGLLSRKNIVKIGVESIPEPPVVTFDDVFGKKTLSRD
jgi:hypothetical protein